MRAFGHLSMCAFTFYRIALQLIANSQSLRTQAEALQNVSLAPFAANDARLGEIAVGVSAVQDLNTNDQNLVNEATFYLDQAVLAFQQVTNWSLNTQGAIYNQMRDAQNIGSSALAAQRTANTSVATVNSFLVSDFQNCGAVVVRHGGSLVDWSPFV